MTFDRGLIAAPFTPFDANGEIQHERVPELVDLYQKNGVSGAFVAGSTGEGASLSHSEKLQLLNTWSQCQVDDLQLIYMIGGTSIQDMQELMRAAARQSYAAVAMVAPYYFKPTSVKLLVSFCAEVLEAVPEFPWYYYHIPAMTGVHFAMSEFIELAQEVPGFAGVKYTASDLMDFQECCMFGQGKYEVLWGTDEALLGALSLGARGAVGSTYNYAAPLYHEVVDHFTKGDHASAMLLQRKAVQVVQFLKRFGGLATGKAIMNILGVEVGAPRLPFRPLSMEDISALERGLREIGFFEFCSRKH